MLRATANVAYYVSYVLLLLTAVSSARAAWRYRDAHHLNILAFVFLHVAVPRAQIFPIVADTIYVLQPYFLLRLVGHFRDVPAIVRNGGLIGGLIGVVTSALVKRGDVLDTVFFGYIGALCVYAAIGFSQEARRKSGVSAKRLMFAASGTWMFALLYGLVILSRWWNDVGQALHPVHTILISIGLTCYFLAFSTPRRLRASWQRAEQANYLTRVAALDPVERARRAGDDLT